MREALVPLFALVVATLPGQEVPVASVNAIVVAPFDNFTTQRALQRRPDDPGASVDRYAETAREAVERALVGANLPVVDRGRLEAVLQEEALAGTGLVDGRSATRVGAKVGARWLVTGNIGAHRELRSKRPVSQGARTVYRDVLETAVVVTVKVIDIATLRVRYQGRYEGTARYEEQTVRDEMIGALGAALALMAKDRALLLAPAGDPVGQDALQAVVLPFANATGERSTLVRRGAGRGPGLDRIGETARDFVEGELVRRGFAVVDRMRLQDAVSELRLGDAGIVDPASSAQLGRFLSARYVITGSVHSFLAPKSKKQDGRRRIDVQDLSVKVLVKVFDVATSRLVHSEDFVGEQRWEGIRSSHDVESVLERALARLASTDALARALRGDG